MLRRLGPGVLAFFGLVSLVAAQQAPSPRTPAPGGAAAVAPADPTRLTPDANGNPRRLAPRTGHVSNYDESKVGTFTLPAALRLADGRPVSDAATWTKQRRPEILRLYEEQIFGRVPTSAPRLSWSVVATNPSARNGASHMKQVVGRAGAGDRAVDIRVTLHTPASATGPVPIILLLNFGGGRPAPAGRGGPAPASDPPIAAEILARGWGYAMVGYNDVQPDRPNAFTEGVIGLSLEPGRTAPASNQWGAISAWAWGVSRIIDYLETDRTVNAKQIALFGFSRNGKAALWASARDERIAAVFAACAGEMGSALSRRDFGETVDDMAHNFPWWFAGSYQQWAGRWSDMPVDAHMLIALSAPRPVFLTGGTGDQWADPQGMFEAAVAAGPVYRLLGERDLGHTTLPAVDVPITTGDIGWLYHTGGHAVPAEDWRAFVAFLGKYFS